MKCSRSYAWLAAVALAAGCTRNNTAPPTDVAAAVQAGGLQYRAETHVAESFPVQLHTTVTVTNPGPQRVRVEMPGGCPVLLRAYRAEDTTRVAFDQGRVLVCTLQIQMLELAPGESHPLQGRSDAREVLGDSLPDGKYVLRAVVRPNGREVEVPAGEAMLAVPR